MLKIKRILYPTDFSSTARQALDHALFLAEQFEAELHMLHAVVLHEGDPRDPQRQFPDPSDILQHLFEIADSELARIIEANQAKTFTLVEAKVKGFAAGEVILEYAEEHDIDLIVMGTHGRRGPARMFLGSVTEEVMRHAKCPVLTLRAQDKTPSGGALEKILVPVDFSDHSRVALSHGREIAALYGSSLQLLHAIEEPIYPYFYAPAGGFAAANQVDELRLKSDAALDRLLEESDGPDVPVEKFVVSGRPAIEITRFAEKHGAGMIVIATHGLTGVERLLVGSTAEQVVRLATCPVFSVKSFGKSLI
jgi:nucleotide-binding universal stress UspA family protein